MKLGWAFANLGVAEVKKILSRACSMWCKGEKKMGKPGGPTEPHKVPRVAAAPMAPVATAAALG